MIWSPEYLAQLLVDAEIDISRKLSLIFQRFSLEIVSGTAVYDLPSYIQGVLRVTWKGRKLTPLFRGELTDFDPSFVTKPGRVERYTLSGDGIFKIRFYPVPNESVNVTTTGLDGVEIGNRVIVSCYRKPDSSSSNLSLPDYLARRTTKYYVLARAFRREGHGQNLKASEYYNNKYIAILGQILKIKTSYFETKVHTIGPGRNNFVSRRPVYASLAKDFQITP